MTFAILPAIDVREGVVVRLSQGDYERQTAYHDSPIDRACAYARDGAQWLHLVDLDAARVGRYTLAPLLKEIQRRAPLQVQTGGGVRTEADVEAVLQEALLRVWQVAPRFPSLGDFDGQFIYCRGLYTSVFREQSGSGWNTDYPGADNNFSVRLAELTRVPVKFDTNRQPHHVVVRLNDPLLFRCGALFMTDIGTAEFSEEEVVNLREYFLKGGFVWVDDSWGSHAWA